jgi:hypothetical protein
MYGVCHEDVVVVLLTLTDKKTGFLMGFDGINGWILWNPNRQSKTIWFLSSVDRQEL